MTKAKTKHRLISLLIGINTYQHVSDLKCCENDVDEMASYLTTRYGKTYDVLEPVILKSEEATKDGIVEAFQEQLIKNARKGDRVLFHFSGHGALENSTEFFREYSTTQVMQGLVCYDTSRVPGQGTCLASKEIRYLISMLGEKECDIISIFDCCHAGIQRNVENVNELKRYEDIGRLTKKFKGRKWEDFIFTKLRGWDHRDLEGGKLNDYIPMRPHLQLSACLSTQLAYEYGMKGQGYFTFALLEALKKSKGNISYLQLQRQVRHYIQSKNIQQSPMVFAPRGNQTDIHRKFILGDQLEAGIQGNICFNGREKEWRMDLGAIHGIKPSSAGDPYPVNVDVADDRSRIANVSKVLLNECVLEFPDEDIEAVDTNKSYRGDLSGLMMDKVPFSIEGDEEGEKNSY